MLNHRANVASIVSLRVELAGLVDLIKPYRGCRITPGPSLSRSGVSAVFMGSELGKCCHGTAFPEG